MNFNYQLQQSETDPNDGSITQHVAVLESAPAYHPQLPAEQQEPWREDEAGYAALIAKGGPMDGNGGIMPGYEPQAARIPAWWPVGGPYWIYIIRWVLVNW